MYIAAVPKRGGKPTILLRERIVRTASEKPDAREPNRVRENSVMGLFPTLFAFLRVCFQTLPRRACGLDEAPTQKRGPRKESLCDFFRGLLTPARGGGRGEAHPRGRGAGGCV